MKYKIDYGFGMADLYTDSENWIERFLKLANQCFGIRKSIAQVVLIEKSNENPKYILEGEFERLKHDGDVIVWNKEGKKIKSEWDD